MDVLLLALKHIVHLVEIMSTVLNVPLTHHIHLEQEEGDDGPITSGSISSRNDPNYCHALVLDRNRSFRCLDESSYSICYDTDYTGGVMDGRVGEHSSYKVPIDRVMDDSEAWGDDPYTHHSQYALCLLRQDILLLCLDCGMNPSDLWPPEAMLLNIYSLKRFLEWQLRLKSTVEDNDPRSLPFMEEGSLSSGSESSNPPLPRGTALNNATSSRRCGVLLIDAHIEKYKMIDAVRKAITTDSRLL